MKKVRNRKKEALKDRIVGVAQALLATLMLLLLVMPEIAATHDTLISKAIAVYKHFSAHWSFELLLISLLVVLSYLHFQRAKVSLEILHLEKKVEEADEALEKVKKKQESITRSQ